MKHLRLSLAALAVLTLAALPASVHAAEVRTDANATVAAGETIDDDFFGMGQTVTIAGRVTGDVYAFGQTVVVSGVVDGDLLTAAQRVVVDGTIRGDVRGGAGEVTINGSVERSVTAVGQEIDLPTNGRVGGTVVGAGQTIGAFGSIGRNLVGVAETMQIGGPIGGDVLARVKTLTVAPTAKIAGELDYHADRQAALPSGAVGGAVTYEQNQERDTPPSSSVLNGLFDLGGLIGLVGSAVLGALVIVLAPRVAARALHAGRRQPLPSLGIGLGALIIVPLVALAVAVTLIGIPVTVVMLAAYTIAVLLAWPALGLLVGTQLGVFVRRGSPLPALVALIVGLIVLHLVTHLPFVGGVIGFFGLALGVGLVVQAARRAAALTSA